MIIQKHFVNCNINIYEEIFINTIIFMYSLYMVVINSISRITSGFGEEIKANHIRTPRCCEQEKCAQSMQVKLLNSESCAKRKIDDT